MTIILALLSILLLTLIVWLFNMISSWKVCALCAGVSGTWIWLLVVQQFGYHVDALVPAMLMGGSVVGIAYQAEKYLPRNRSPLLWKTFFLPLGFLAVYSVFVAWWAVFVSTLVVIALGSVFFFTLFFQGSNQKDTQKVDELENKMKKCC